MREGWRKLLSKIPEPGDILVHVCSSHFFEELPVCGKHPGFMDPCQGNVHGVVNSNSKGHLMRLKGLNLSTEVRLTRNKRSAVTWQATRKKKADLKPAFGVCILLLERSPSSLHQKPALAKELTHRRVSPFSASFSLV